MNDQYPVPSFILIGPGSWTRTGTRRFNSAAVMTQGVMSARSTSLPFMLSNRNLVYTPNFLAVISAGGLVGDARGPGGEGRGG